MESSRLLKKALEEWTTAFMYGSMHGLLLYAKGSGLSMSQICALMHIQRMGMTDVSDVGDDLGVTHAAASQMLDRLVLQGLVARSEDPHDRRVKQIVLTDEGQHCLRESMQVRRRWLDNLAELLSPKEQEQVTAALGVLVERAHQLEAEAAPTHA